MSGIYGFVTTTCISDEKRTALTSSLKSFSCLYGKDGYGETHGENYAIGSFIEHYSDSFPSGSAVIEEGKFLFSVDCVIYNRDELSENTNISDENLVAGIASEKGFGALCGINGDFAGAAYDKEEKELTLFRDHLGVRQLYYYCDGSVFAWSTDIRSLTSLPGADLSIDEEIFIIEMRGQNSNCLEKTEFNRIKCVLPGGILKVKAENGKFVLNKERYFLPGEKKLKGLSDEEYISEMKELITDSIRRRANAFDCPIAAELSGGLDSSVIDIILNRLGFKAEYIAWRTAPDSLPLQEVDERRVISDICKSENITCTYLRENEESDEYLSLPEVPFANTRSLGYTARFAKSKGCRVVFSGQGGDEGVSHRANVMELLHSHEYLSYLREVFFSCKGRNLPFVRGVYTVLRHLLKDYPKKKKPWKPSDDIIDILRDDFKSKMKKTDGYPFFFSIDPKAEFEQGGIRLRPETASYRAAPYGVRYVFPYEDYRLFDYALSIPRRMFLKNGINRLIYRKAFDSIMPQSLREVDYKDFPSLRNAKKEDGDNKPLPSVKEYISESLDTEIWREYIDFDKVRKLSEPENREEYEKYTPLLIQVSKMKNIQNLIKQRHDA